MNDKVKALVLSVNDYRENDLILQVITEDRSFLSLVGKSVKKISSKQHFSSLCVYEFLIDYKDNKTIFSIHNSKLVDSFYEDSNLKLLSFKNILVEMTLKSKELYEVEMYNNLVFSLKNINEKNMYLLGSLYTSYLLKIHGINPNVDKCVVCGNEKVVSISNDLGGFLCVEHIGQNEPYDVECLKRFRLINKAQFINYDVIKNIEYEMKDFDIMMNFFIDNSDLNINSYKLYKELFI